MEPEAKFTCDNDGYCDSIRKALSDTTCKIGKAGLFSHCVLEIKDNRRVMYSVIVLKSGDFKPNGVVINHCPFCGADLKSVFECRRTKALEGK